jgi:hypothetical protein
MGKTPCFVCKNNLGWTDIGYSVSHYQGGDLVIPEGLTETDKVCNKCFKKSLAVHLDQKNEENRKIKELEKQQKHEISAEQKQIMDDIRARVPLYKPRWNKGEVLEYKDEYCAILRRHFGEQVEFIIAYSDLSKEGYRLVAQDEGKTVSSGGLSGGMNSYYYFQKIEHVR